MTKHEAICTLSLMATELVGELAGTDSDESNAKLLKRYIDSVNMAISALRQQEHRCPCDLCNFGPPSSMRGKPCTMCPAVPKQETVTERNELTNADRIRAMSDEELCDLLDEWWCMGANNEERLAYADERLAWLQQLAGEEKEGADNA